MTIFSVKVLVHGNINNAFLDQLIPDTPYSVSVSALYADGNGPAVNGNGKTRELDFMIILSRQKINGVSNAGGMQKHDRISHLLCMTRICVSQCVKYANRKQCPFQCHVPVPETSACLTPPQAHSVSAGITLKDLYCNTKSHTHQ